LTSLAIIDSRNTLTTGIAAQTLASKRSYAVLLGRSKEFGTMAREQLLVGGDDRFAGCKQLKHPAARRLDATHHLSDNRDRRVIANLSKI
jgi:hypothetical protein